MYPVRRIAAGFAIAAAVVAGGAVGATLFGTASAQTDTTAPSTSSTAAPSQPDNDSDHGPGKGGHQANGKTETALTGDNLTKATAAAKAAVSGGTVERAETDAEGAAYEVHMTKSDGSEVTVKLDANFKVTDTVDGRG